MKVALVYDRVNKIGGAERVMESLHSLYPDAPICTAVYNPATAPWAKDIKIIPSFLNRIPGARTRHEWLPLFTPYAFESFDLSAYDVVISVTSSDAKAVITSPKQLHICYLLTPTRYLWSHRQEYAGKGLAGIVRSHLMTGLQQWDAAAASRPDEYIAISRYVADRCTRYYHRSPDKIIYPPVQVSKFINHPETCTQPGEDYFLTVSRLVPYKRVDLAIEACNRMRAKLIVVGSGSQLPKLKKLAGPTIHFAGQVDDYTLACLYHHAQALIFPQEEEFGIAAVEAQAAGIPVAAFGQGSAPEIVKHGQTGILFPEQSIDSLVAALTALKNHTWYDTTIQGHARSFSDQIFLESFKLYVEDAWQRKQHRE